MEIRPRNPAPGGADPAAGAAAAPGATALRVAVDFLQKPARIGSRTTCEVTVVNSSNFNDGNNRSAAGSAAAIDARSCVPGACRAARGAGDAQRRPAQLFGMATLRRGERQRYSIPMTVGGPAGFAEVSARTSAAATMLADRSSVPCSLKSSTCSMQAAGRFGYDGGMPRFVVLRHECQPGFGKPSHWDLMLEDGAALLTWSLLELPTPGGAAVAAQRLPEHRLVYLEFEGPLSRGRGEVRRVAAGDLCRLAPRLIAWPRNSTAPTGMAAWCSRTSGTKRGAAN